MKTNRELIYQIKNLIKERYSDSRVTNKFVYSILSKMAKLLIKRESDGLKLLKFQNLYQSLNCVDVIEAPLIDPCCGIKSFCSVWRTKDKLPEMYEDSMGVIIYDVLSIDSSFPYEFRTAESVRRKLENPWVKKYNKNTTYSFYDNGYLYFTKRIVKVKVKAMFIRDISRFNTCEKQPPCIKFLDELFYIPDYLEQGLISMTLEEFAKIYKAIPDDMNSNKNAQS